MRPDERPRHLRRPGRAARRARSALAGATAAGVVAAAVGLGAASTAAYAAPTTCDGRAVTYTGTPGQPLVTSEFDDVVQANGASIVTTLDGNDLVCQDVDPGGTVSISTGLGNDRVLLGDPFAAGTALPAWTGTVNVDLGDGTDQLRTQMVAHGAFTGGPGSDLYRTADTNLPLKGKRAPRSRLALDLAAGTLAVSGTPGSAATAFDDVYVTGFQTTKITGDDLVNRLFTSTCAGTLKGGDGDDTLAATKSTCTLAKAKRFITFRAGGGADLVAGSRHRNRIFGDAGGDTLFGDFGDDLIVGGTGKDKAIGGPGRDRCQAEKRRSCERR